MENRYLGPEGRGAEGMRWLVWESTAWDIFLVRKTFWLLTAVLVKGTYIVCKIAHT